MYVHRIRSYLTVEHYSFDIVKKFIRLDAIVNAKNDVRLEIEREIALTNICHYGLNR